MVYLRLEEKGKQCAKLSKFEFSIFLSSIPHFQKCCDCVLEASERVSSSLAEHKSKLFHQHSSSSVFQMSGDCALQERERVSSSFVEHKSQLFHQHSSSSSSLFSNIFLFDQKKGRKENSSRSSPLFQTTFCLSGRGEESILLYSNINLFYQNSSSSSLFQITLYLS